MPRETRVEMVPTGLSLAAEWERRDTEGRRELLTDAVEAMLLGPGTRGRHGFDPNRLLVIWAEGEHDPDG